MTGRRGYVYAAAVLVTMDAGTAHETWAAYGPFPSEMAAEDFAQAVLGEWAPTINRWGSGSMRAVVIELRQPKIEKKMVMSGLHAVPGHHEWKR